MIKPCRTTTHFYRSVNFNSTVNSSRRSRSYKVGELLVADGAVGSLEALRVHEAAVCVDVTEADGRQHLDGGRLADVLQVEGDVPDEGLDEPLLQPEPLLCLVKRFILDLRENKPYSLNRFPSTGFVSQDAPTRMGGGRKVLEHPLHTKTFHRALHRQEALRHFKMEIFKIHSIKKENCKISKKL